MGLIDWIKSLFENNETPIDSLTRSDDYFGEGIEKNQLVEQIIDLVGKIQFYAPFDQSIHDLHGANKEYYLKRKSLEDLRILKNTLEEQYLHLKAKSERPNPTAGILEDARWKGEKLPGMTDGDLDRSQRWYD